MEEVSTFEKGNVSNSENLMESNATKSQLDDKLDVVETQNNLKVDAKVKTDLTAKRVTVTKNVVAVCVKKSVADGTVAKEPDPNANAVAAK